SEGRERAPRPRDGRHHARHVLARAAEPAGGSGAEDRGKRWGTGQSALAPFSCKALLCKLNHPTEGWPSPVEGSGLENRQGRKPSGVRISPPPLVTCVRCRCRRRRPCCPSKAPTTRRSTASNGAALRFMALGRDGAITAGRYDRVQGGWAATITIHEGAHAARPHAADRCDGTRGGARLISPGRAGCRGGPLPRRRVSSQELWALSITL